MGGGGTHQKDGNDRHGQALDKANHPLLPVLKALRVEVYLCNIWLVCDAERQIPGETRVPANPHGRNVELVVSRMIGLHLKLMIEPVCKGIPLRPLCFDSVADKNVKELAVQLEWSWGPKVQVQDSIVYQVGRPGLHN